MVRRLRRMPVFDDFREPTGFGNYSFKIGSLGLGQYWPIEGLARWAIDRLLSPALILQPSQMA
jgi:hypothetical protein